MGTIYLLRVLDQTELYQLLNWKEEINSYFGKNLKDLDSMQENKTISNFSVQKSDDNHHFRTKKYPVMNRTFFVRGDKGHIANT